MRMAKKKPPLCWTKRHRDALEQLLLRARLTDLALDKQAQAQNQARLDAIGKQEGDELRVVHNRDQAALSFYQKQLDDDNRRKNRETHKRCGYEQTRR